MPKSYRNGFIILFAAIYCVLYAAYACIPDSYLHEKIYYYAIVWPTAALIDFAAPSAHVIGVQNRLQSPAVILNIVRGCDGAPVMFLLVAAIIAHRAPWGPTLRGAAGGVALIYALNQLRIVVLYFLLAQRPDWFTAMHVYFIPTFLILAGALYFALWAGAGVATSQDALTD
jgi:exosortase family protein XrtM